MAKFKIVNNEIIIDRVITKLDQFTLDVVEIIRKHTDYVIISGYVSIFFGRNRGTEDVDMFIKPISYDKFEQLYLDFVNTGFEFNIENPSDLYNLYLLEGSSINVWRKGKPNLRMEIKFAKKMSQLIQLQQPVVVHFGNSSFKFSQIEAQIAYKRAIAKSQKDLEDARHLEIVFENLDEEKIKYYKRLFLDEFNKC